MMQCANACRQVLRRWPVWFPGLSSPCAHAEHVTPGIKLAGLIVRRSHAL